MTTQCRRCRKRSCPRDGTCVPRVRRYKGICEGAGHPGGAKYRKACSTCGTTKANTAFRHNSTVCTACQNQAAAACSRCHIRQAEPQRSTGLCSTCRKGHGQIRVGSVQELRGTRIPFDAWMDLIRATEADHDAVRRAAERYGLRAPTPDDVLDAHLAVHPRPRYGQLFHAVVLLATERGAGRVTGAYPRGKNLRGAA